MSAPSRAHLKGPPRLKDGLKRCGNQFFWPYRKKIIFFWDRNLMWASVFLTRHSTPGSKLRVSPIRKARCWKSDWAQWLFPEEWLVGNVGKKKKMLDINSIKKASVCLESCHCASFAKELNLEKVLKFVILNFMLSGPEHCNKLKLYKKNPEKQWETWSISKVCNLTGHFLCNREGFFSHASQRVLLHLKDELRIQ